MPIRFVCPHCRQKLSVAQRKAGEQADCPRCHQSLTIPQPPMDAAAPAAAIPPPPAVANPPPLGEDAAFLPDADDFHGLEPVYDANPPETLPAAPPPADVVIVPRYVLYLQAGLIAAVALIAFTIGILFGITLTPQPAAGPQACKVTGSVMHRSGPRNLPEAGAVVILLPQTAHRPDEKVPVTGLRPGEQSPDDQTKSLAMLQQLGGGFARTDSSGRFELEVPRRGRYLLLVISRDQQSRRDSEAKAADIQKLRPFFDNPAQLLGDRRYQLSTESFRGDRELTIALD